MLTARLCNRKLNKNSTLCLHIWKMLTLCSLKVLELIFCLHDCWRFNKLRRTDERQQHLFADLHMHTRARVARPHDKIHIRSSTSVFGGGCQATGSANAAPEHVERASSQLLRRPAARLCRQNTHLAYGMWKQKKMFSFRAIFTGGGHDENTSTHFRKESMKYQHACWNVCLALGFIRKINWINRIYQQNWTGRKKINVSACSACAYVPLPRYNIADYAA